jgi:lipoate-protein ligase A
MAILHGKSILKEKNQKLVKIRLSIDRDSHTITNIRISGDFFIHPEECIEVLEKSLLGIPAEQTAVRETVTKVVNTEQAQLYGLTIDGLIKAIMLASEDALKYKG